MTIGAPRRKPTAPTRVKQASRAESAARVDEIAARMRALTFVRGVTARELAAAWGLSTDHVERMTAEASRRVRAEKRTPDEVRDMLQAALERVISAAFAAGDLRVVVEAARALTPIVGAAAPTRVQVEVDARPVAERVAEARELAAEVVDLASRLEK